jgi:hypothetical protein
MNKFLQEYKRLFVEDKSAEEKELENSTELLDENDEAVYNESVGKWLKNIFKSKEGKLKEIYKTWFKTCKEYGFKAIRDEDGDLNPQCQAKREGDSGEYLVIYRLYEADSHKYIDSQLTVKDWETGKPIQNLDKVDIRIKHSWTEKEIVKAINDLLANMGLELTTSSHGKVTGLDGKKSEQKNSQNQQQSGNSSSNTQSHQSTLSQAETTFGMSAQELLPRINQVGGPKQEKIGILKALRSGWAKLTGDEKKIFQDLQ